MLDQLKTILIYVFLFSYTTHHCSGNQDHGWDGDAQDYRESIQKSPKDRVALRDIDVLTFYRGKRTTHRRTHSIAQLSCVGGTAGCKLFTPNSVQCKNNGYSEERLSVDWKCSAEMSDRVKFNHIDVICEGYDYAEDEHILVGSCGLEFTLDYTDPHDYHHHSYFHHLDEDEKEKHHKRINSAISATSKQGFSRSSTYMLCAIIITIVSILLVWKFIRFIKRSKPRSGLLVEGQDKRVRPILQKASKYPQSTSSPINFDKRSE